MRTALDDPDRAVRLAAEHALRQISVPTAIEKEAPGQPRVWLYMATGYDKRQLGLLEQGERLTWGANHHTLAGDMVLMYRTPPYSDIAYLFRATSDARPVKEKTKTWRLDYAVDLGDRIPLIKPVSLHQIRNHPSLAEWSIAKSPQGALRRGQDIREEGYWEALRGLIVAWNPISADTLVDWEGTDRDHLFTAALEVTRGIPDEKERAEVLVDLAHSLPASLIEDAWSVARTIGSPQLQAKPLMHLISRLFPQEAQRLLPEALVTFSQAIGPETTDAALIASRGDIFWRLQRYQEAMADFDRAIEIEPEYAWALAHRGHTHRRLGHYEEALADFDKSIELNGNYYWAFDGRGTVYRQMGRYEKALVDFDRATELEHDDIFGIGGRGNVYRLMGRYEEALIDLKQVIEIDAANIWAIATRGETHREMGRYEEALADLNRAIDLEPSNSWALARRGRTYHELGRYEDALADFDRAIELEPNNASVHACRGELYQRMSRSEEALADLKRALEAVERVAEPVIRIATVASIAKSLAKVGQEARAREVLNGAARTVEQIQDPAGQARAKAVLEEAQAVISRRVLDFSAFIADRTRGFIGREWAFAEVDKWLATLSGPHFFLITGSPGSGKSAVAARLTQIREVAAYHFCMADRPETTDPRAFVASIILQLINSFPGFGFALLQGDGPSIKVNQSIDMVESGGKVVGVHIGTLDLGAPLPRLQISQSVGSSQLNTIIQNIQVDNVLLPDAPIYETFHRFLVEPLRGADPSRSTVFLVDGLDVARSQPTGDSMLDLIFAATDISPQVRILVTARPDPQVLKMIRYERSLDLDQDVRSLADVREYVAAQVEANESLRDLLAEERIAPEQLVAALVEKSGPNFVIARSILDDLNAGKRTVHDLVAPSRAREALRPTVYSNFMLDAFDYRYQDGAETFSVRVVDSPAGQQWEAERVSLPAHLRDRMRDLESQSFDEQQMIVLGETLGSLLLPPSVRELLERSLVSLAAGEGLRLCLRLDSSVASLPWEYVYLPSPDTPMQQKNLSGFLALDPRFSLVRYQPLPTPRDVLAPAGAGPLRVAVVLADPNEGGRLNLEKEQHNIAVVLQDVEGLETMFIPRATVSGVADALASAAPHIFHFVGHGSGVSGGEHASLVMGGKGRQAEHFPAEKLAVILGAKGIRLVVLAPVG